MLDINKIPSPILEIISAGLPMKSNGPRDIAMLSNEEAMDAFLKYNGIIGWTSKILEVWNAIESAFVGDLPDSVFDKPNHFRRKNAAAMEAALNKLVDLANRISKHSEVDKEIATDIRNIAMPVLTSQISTPHPELMEAVADIAFELGFAHKRLVDTDDSRANIAAIIDTAENFEAKHANTNWDEDADYTEEMFSFIDSLPTFSFPEDFKNNTVFNACKDLVAYVESLGIPESMAGKNALIAAQIALVKIDHPDTRTQYEIRPVKLVNGNYEKCTPEQCSSWGVYKRTGDNYPWEFIADCTEQAYAEALVIAMK